MLGAVNVPGVYSITKNDEVLDNIITKAGGFTDLAFEDGIEMYRGRQRVVLRDYSILVMNGDSVHIPRHPGVVLVTGEVYNAGLIHYKKGRSLKEYVESAGGFTIDADRWNVSVIYANGDVKLKRYIFDPRVREGATVIVHRKEEREPFDSTKFLTELASITASLATIWYLIEARSP